MFYIIIYLTNIQQIIKELLWAHLAERIIHLYGVCTPGTTLTVQAIFTDIGQVACNRTEQSSKDSYTSLTENSGLKRIWKYVHFVNLNKVKESHPILLSGSNLKTR